MIAFWNVVAQTVGGSTSLHEWLVFAGVVVSALAASFAAIASRATRRDNTQDHGSSYSLLESIDRRTSDIKDTLLDHGERISALEQHADESGAHFRHHRGDR